MKRFFAPLMLLSLLVLAACSDTAPEVTPAPDAAGFRFDIDPNSQQVSVTSIGMETLQIQQAGEARLLEPGAELGNAGFSVSRAGNNVFIINAAFQNFTLNETFRQPFTFRPALTPQQGNYLSSTEPTVAAEALGGDGALSPGETTSSLTFRIKHKGERFSYFVNAYAVVETREGGLCDNTDVINRDVVIRTQEDVNLLRGCRNIQGSLTIATRAKTLDFSPLDDLEIVDGFFTVESGSRLTSISGFNGLKTVAMDERNLFSGGFQPFFDPSGESVVSISGFGQLEEIGGDGFFLAGGDVLTSVTGFENLRKTTLFQIIVNSALVSIPEFESLETVTKLEIAENDALVSFSGFNNLELIAPDENSSNGFISSLEIRSNNALVSFSGFEKLRVIGDPSGEFAIENNPSLVSIPEFGALEIVSVTNATTSALSISDNASLPSISGFGQLRQIGQIDSIGAQGSLAINNNASLTSISGFGNLNSDSVSEVSQVNGNIAFNCSIPPQNGLPFLPVDESTGNLVNCPTR